MDASAITQIVSTVGFPIAMCLLLAWYVKTLNDNHTQQINKLNQEHKEEVKQMTEAVQNNTITIQKLVDLLQKGLDDYE